MGLDQYATVLLSVPEHESAIIPPTLFSKINDAIYQLELFDKNQGPDRLQIADYPLLSHDYQTYQIYNFKNFNYEVPIFQLNFQKNDYLARNNYKLKDFIFNRLKPQLNLFDIQLIEQLKNECNMDIQTYTMDNYFDITNYIPRINRAISKGIFPHNFEINLNHLLTYQKACQNVLNTLNTNLAAHVCYRQDF